MRYVHVANLYGNHQLDIPPPVEGAKAHLIICSLQTNADQLNLVNDACR